MVKKYYLLLIMLAVNIAFGANIAANKEHVLWDKLPITFIVPTGNERIISFPERVTVNSLDNNLTRDKVTIINNHGSLYIKAIKEFTPVRVAVVLQDSKEAILVDISSEPNAANVPLEVLTAQKDVPNESVSEKNEKSHAVVDYVSLMRSAIQELYAPDRLIEQNLEIKRAPMFTEKSVPLFWEQSVIAMPLASWSTDRHYITAVILKNHSKKSFTLSLKYIRGNWLAASFYPSDMVEARGKKNDRTTLFLISAKPFSDALNSQKEVI